MHDAGLYSTIFNVQIHIHLSILCLCRKLELHHKKMAFRFYHYINNKEGECTENIQYFGRKLHDAHFCIFYTYV